MKLLDLFCGAGGCSVGYYKAGFTDITGVDIIPQTNYPFKFIQADAIDFPLDGFDFIHASPPCQCFISSGRAGRGGQNHINFLPQTREKLQHSGLPYVIENIIPAPLVNPIILCGNMFGLKVYRHRKFETSWQIEKPKHIKHSEKVIRRLGDGGKFYAVLGHEVGSLSQWRDAMGIDWMKTKRELAEAIPPAYTEYVGKDYLNVLA